MMTHFKNIMFILGVALNGVSLYATDENLLTDKEADAVLQDISDRCGDTWCEGDFNFSFDELSCTKQKSCELKLTYLWNEQLETHGLDDIETIETQQNCKLKGFKTRSDILTATSHLTDAFVKAISECIDSRESHALAEVGRWKGEFFLEKCSSADVTDVYARSISKTEWQWRKVFAQLKAVSANSAPKGHLSRSYEKNIDDSLVETSDCKKLAQQFFPNRYFPKATIIVVNEADEETRLTLMRWQPLTKKEKVYEITLVQSFSN